MKIRMPHTPYIARKIVVDLLNCGFVTLSQGTDIVSQKIEDLIVVDVKKEASLDEHVNRVLDENSDEIDFMQIDRRSMFWLIKKKLAKDYGVILFFEDRYSDLSHKILDVLVGQNLIDFNVSENRVKNVIFASIEKYLESFEKIQEEVADKMENYKRKLISGTEEYDIVFERLYEEELKRKGIL